MCVSVCGECVFMLERVWIHCNRAFTNKCKQNTFKLSLNVLLVGEGLCQGVLGP